jgi:hypothetical protein
MNQNDNRPAGTRQAAEAKATSTRPLEIAYLMEDGHWTDDAVAALRERGAEVYPNRSEINDLRDVDAIVTAQRFMSNRVQVMVRNIPRYVRPIWEHQTPADYAEAILKAVHDLQADNPVKPRTGWREDGRVDIDAVRAGTHDVNDSPAVFESLCDEVEELREIVRQVGSMQDRIPDDQNGDWGIGWDDGYNAALDEVRAVAKGGDL